MCILHNKSNLEIPRSPVFREVQVTERANASIQQIIALLKNDSYTASCILGRLNNAQPVRAYSHRHVDSKLGDYLQWLIYTLTYKIFGLTIRSWEGTLVPGPTHINYNNNNLRIDVSFLNYANKLTKNTAHYIRNVIMLLQ